MKKGKKNWIFCDGYLPPHGDNPEFEGHEALMITNLNEKEATVDLKFIFEDKEPEGNISYKIGGISAREDFSLASRFSIPYG